MAELLRAVARLEHVASYAGNMRGSGQATCNLAKCIDD